MRPTKVKCVAHALVDKLVMRKKKPESSSREKSKTMPVFIFPPDYGDLFDNLPDELVLSIFGKLCASADSPKDFFNALITCKRLCGIGFNPYVLSKASCKTLAVKAKNWSESAFRFLKMCADTGNIEACYTLGMIQFYCLQNRSSGKSLIAKAAIGNHSHALYSMAVIQFNGSGGPKSNKDPRAGVALCARAFFAGHVEALREVGLCIMEGYGIKQNVWEGRRFIIQANARELAHVVVATPDAIVPESWIAEGPTRGGGSPLLSACGCNLPALAPHPANQFLSEWCSDPVRACPGPGLRVCSHLSCGRPETRRHEFHRCSICGTVNYCSRACHALDWKRRHKIDCKPLERIVEDDEETEEDVRNFNVGHGDLHINGINNEQLLYNYDFMEHYLRRKGVKMVGNVMV